jgi:hypothetical protein
VRATGRTPRRLTSAFLTFAREALGSAAVHGDAAPEAAPDTAVG